MEEKIYIYEIIEDYKSASEEEKENILNNFFELLWVYRDKRRLRERSVSFKVSDELTETEIGNIFSQYAEQNYTWYVKNRKETDSLGIIRRKINNLYSRYFDKKIILNKDYKNMLCTPKTLYYKWLSGEAFDEKALCKKLTENASAAEKFRSFSQGSKINMSWEKYKELISSYIRRIFENCDLNADSKCQALSVQNIYDLKNEDHIYVRYICKSLEGYIKNFQKEYYGLKRGRGKKYKNCEICGSLTEIKSPRTKYCPKCAKKVNSEKTLLRRQSSKKAV